MLLLLFVRLLLQKLLLFLFPVDLKEHQLLISQADKCAFIGMINK